MLPSAPLELAAARIHNHRRQYRAKQAPGSQTLIVGPLPSSALHRVRVYNLFSIAIRDRRARFSEKLKRNFTRCHFRSDLQPLWPILKPRRCLRGDKVRHLMVQPADKRQELRHDFLLLARSRSITRRGSSFRRFVKHRPVSHRHQRIPAVVSAAHCIQFIRLGQTHALGQLNRAQFSCHIGIGGVLC